MKRTATSCYILPLLLCAAGAAQATDHTADSFTEMFTKGKAGIDLRYRYEHVSDDALDRSGMANTLRSRLTLETAAWYGVSGLIEGDNVWDFESDNYNSLEHRGRNNKQWRYPVIADPTGTGLNQVWLRYAGKTYDGTLGRQRINHGNQRFVGGVSWRQNEQTFEAFRATWRPWEVLNLDFSYVDKVKRVFGPDDGALPADWEGDNYLARADYQLNDRQKISAFGYWLDIDSDGPYSRAQTVNNSSDTYGIEYRGNFDRWSAAATYAHQSDAGSSKLNYDADYYMVELGARASVFDLKAGYEVLASDNDVGFQTPLATLHKFQGWADQFLVTPGGGIEDIYGSAGTTLGPVKLSLIYHDFQAESGGGDYGQEWDMVATWALTKRFTVQAHGAHFLGDDDYEDVDKIWFTAQYKM